MRKFNPLYMETPKGVLLQTVKTQMKCHMWHFIRVYTACLSKKDLQNTFFENYNLTPLDMYNGLSKVYCIIQEGIH